MGNQAERCCTHGPCAAVNESKLAELSTSSHTSVKTGLETKDDSILPNVDMDYNRSKLEPVASSNGGSRGSDDTITLRDGSTYSGQLVDGRRHGRGVLSTHTSEYQGQWERDAKHGEGRESWKDGRLYVGSFRNGKIDGVGRMEWRTSQGVMVYEGQYLEDLKHGRGKFSWPDGRVYDGQWENGKRSGEATYISSRGEQRRGFWSKDKLQQWLDQIEEVSQSSASRVNSKE
mmetsp:Transcript_14365/g.23484  ORF Transcript_14365/g.23484 Transcript_14365/m.23484 type:complete len:231 (-) Transcript_14365:26-718(-)